MAPLPVCERAFLVAQVVKNLLAMQEILGLIPNLGRSHKAYAPQLLSLCSGAQELQLLKFVRPEPGLHNKRSHHSEKPMQHNQRVAPTHCN